MVVIVCPKCDGTSKCAAIDDIAEAEDATMDCARCSALLVVKEGKVLDFHAWMHEQDERWPIDGSGTGFVEF